jgi:hypothetical protein
MPVASIRPPPSFKRAALATIFASACGAMGGSFGLISCAILIDPARLQGPGEALAVVLTWLLTAPLAIFLGSLPALVGVVLIGWPVAVLLNSRGWFGPVSMVAAGALSGSAAGFLILPTTGNAEEFPVALLAGLFGGVGVGLGLQTGFGAGRRLDTAAPQA